MSNQVRDFKVVYSLDRSQKGIYDKINHHELNKQVNDKENLEDLLTKFDFLFKNINTFNNDEIYNYIKYIRSVSDRIACFSDLIFQERPMIQSFVNLLNSRKEGLELEKYEIMLILNNFAASNVIALDILTRELQNPSLFVLYYLNTGSLQYISSTSKIIITYFKSKYAQKMYESNIIPAIISRTKELIKQVSNIHSNEVLDETIVVLLTLLRDIFIQIPQDLLVPGLDLINNLATTVLECPTSVRLMGANIRMLESVRSKLGYKPIKDIFEKLLGLLNDHRFKEAYEFTLRLLVNVYTDDDYIDPFNIVSVQRFVDIMGEDISGDSYKQSIVMAIKTIIFSGGSYVLEQFLKIDNFIKSLYKMLETCNFQVRIEILNLFWVILFSADRIMLGELLKDEIFYKKFFSLLHSASEDVVCELIDLIARIVQTIVENNFAQQSPYSRFLEDLKTYIVESECSEEIYDKFEHIINKYSST